MKFSPEFMARFPPFNRRPASAADHSTKGGAERLAKVIRDAWAKVGVVAEVEIAKVQLVANKDKDHWLVRLDMPGGSPWR